jgi:hypothetical protein
MRSKKSIMGVIGLVLITGMIFMGCDSGTNSDTTEPQPNGIRITGAEEGSDFTVVVFEQSITYAAMT